MMATLAERDGFASVWFAAYHLSDQMPYVMVHGGLLTPLFAAIILGLSALVMKSSPLWVYYEGEKRS